ncbi:MAG: HepT-like ribonuclease domain-containing protein [Microthrixaceae bacterium]
MPRDPRAYLWDARKAATLVDEFVAGRTWEEYESDPLLRSAVERQFEIVGEALNQLRRVEPELADRVPDLPRIVAFRNLLIHGYASIDGRLVWEVATERAASLAIVLDNLLHEHP